MLEFTTDIPDSFIEQESIEHWHAKLAQHPFYQELKCVEALKVFMRFHVFAVWDFMSLLKSLQRHVTCVDLPWRPSAYPKKLTRLVNEIVLGEESDLDLAGEPIDHFSLYLRAMKEVGACTDEIENFLVHLDMNQLPEEVREFVSFNLDLALNGQVHEVAAAFFFGREKLIPGMFDGIVQELKRSKQPMDHLLYYLERHIELDGGEHSHMAQDCLDLLCENDDTKNYEAQQAGLKSLKLRYELWDKSYQSYLSRTLD